MVYYSDYGTEALKIAPDFEDIDVTDAQKRLLVGALGVCGESGEVAEMVKKHVFHGHPFNAASVEKLVKELGDVIWYVNYLAERCAGVDIGNVMHANVKKLRARYPEGSFSTDRSLHRAEGDV